MSGSRTKLKLEPTVLRWARERSGLGTDELALKLGVKEERVVAWESSGEITIAQTNNLANSSRTPLGFLFLNEPPAERLPIPDFRTIKDRPVRRPSPDLLDTVRSMHRRVLWMHDELANDGVVPVWFVGGSNTGDGVATVVQTMRMALDLQTTWASEFRNRTDALRYLRERVETSGVLVVINGIVGNNTHRKLDPDEFRGFSIADDLSPLIFINGADAKSAQIFTLIHEFVHVCLGIGGVSGADVAASYDSATETFCNWVAAEFLVPAVEIRATWKVSISGSHEYRTLADHFKVSELVIARRALDLSLISRQDFFNFYDVYSSRVVENQVTEKSGGNFWNTQNSRIGRRFGAAVVRALREGRLLYRDAYSLTGLKGRTFDRFVRSVSEAR